jgi:general L-amino acid transport system permease protein
MLALNWGVIHAVFQIDEAACQNARGEGACWGVIGEKFRLILWGRFPFEEQWRSATACVLTLAMLALSVNKIVWTPSNRPFTLGAWCFSIVGFHTLMSGSLFGLSFLQIWPHVDTELWGGLPLTLILSLGSIALATPMGILLALGRTSEMPIIRSICVLYIELVRGVPLISVLFMASFMFPLLLPSLQTPDVLIRVLLGITLFSAAYTAEVVRGGLQAVDQGQQEASQSLNLGYWQTQRYVILPQALTHIIPGMVNNFIAIFKDTSLVTIVSLYELTGSLGLALNGDANWRAYKLEGYLFIAAIYFFFCFTLSQISQNLENRLTKR